MNTLEKNVLIDCLHNCEPVNLQTEENIRYAKGILIGVIAGLMSSNGANFKGAIRTIRELKKSTGRNIDFDRRIIPESYLPDFFPDEFPLRESQKELCKGYSEHLTRKIRENRTS